jgi:hypothetical protein
MRLLNFLWPQQPPLVYCNKFVIACEMICKQRVGDRHFSMASKRSIDRPAWPAMHALPIEPRRGRFARPEDRRDREPGRVETAGRGRA